MTSAPMTALRASIAYVLIRDGEGTPRDVSRALNLDTTTVSIALKEMFDAREITRMKIWHNGSYTYSYRHPSAGDTKLTAKAPTADDLARIIFCDGKRVGKLTPELFNAVQRAGASGDKCMRITGPDPATKAERVASMSRGVAIPARQHLTLDIAPYYDTKGGQPLYGLVAPNKRTIDAFLQWHPEYKL